jgi:tyrosyl-tRNA synthetase
VEDVLLPVSALKIGGTGRFVVERREGEGEPLVYENIQALKDDYMADNVRILCTTVNPPY